MYISKLLIRNFRNFPLAEISFSKNVTALVGPNSAGKSNIVAALRLLFDPFLPWQGRLLEEDDFYDRLSVASGKEILISATISDFEGNDYDRAYCARWKTAKDEAHLTYRFRPNETVRYAALERQTERAAAMEKVAADADAPIGIPEPWIFRLDEYEYDRFGGKESSAGKSVDLSSVTIYDEFGNNAERDLRDFAYVEMPAVRDVVRDMSSRRTSPLHRLLDVSDIQDDVKKRVEDAVREANAAIRSDEFFAELESSIDASYESLAAAPDKLNVKVGIADPTFSAAIRSLSLLLTDDRIVEAEMSRNGLGYNNLLYIAILLRYFKQRSVNKGSSQLLVLEDPEAHLHPNSQIALLHELMKRPHQTIVTSHSAYCLMPIGIENVVAISKGKDGSVATNMLSSIGADEQDKADLNRYLDANRGALLFARKVILVEGISEEILLRAFAQELGIKLGQKNVAIVPVVGTHFSVLSRLVAASAIESTCHLVRDGDLQNDKRWLRSRRPDTGVRLEPVVEGSASVYRCETTLEMAITQPQNQDWIVSAIRSVGAPQVANKVESGMISGSLEKLQLAQLAVVRVASRFGKGRFAQTLANQISRHRVIPDYLRAVLEEIDR